jgi:hypothetical protein
MRWIVVIRYLDGVEGTVEVFAPNKSEAAYRGCVKAEVSFGGVEKVVKVYSTEAHRKARRRMVAHL